MSFKIVTFKENGVNSFFGWDLLPFLVNSQFLTSIKL